MDDEAPDYIPPQPIFPRMSRRAFFFMALPLLMISLAIIAVTLFSAYQMAEKRNNAMTGFPEVPMDEIAELSPEPREAAEAAPGQREEANTTTEPASELGEGWTYKSDSSCSVKIPIPPKKEPYYKPWDGVSPRSVGQVDNNGSFWMFPRGASYPNMLSKLSGPDGEWRQSATTYLPEDAAGGGFIPAMVAVSCIPNDGRFGTNDEMMDGLETAISEYNDSEKEYGMEPVNYQILESGYTQRWGRDVADLKVWEDPLEQDYTMFVTPGFIYEVKIIRQAEDEFVAETARKIFDNLVFE